MTRSSALRAVSAALLLAGASLLLTRCGGSGNHQNIVTSGSNVQPISVNGGPANNYANGVFVSVTVCVPSTSNCQTINDVLVDTGSYGLRLLASSSGGALTLPLPTQSGPVGECAPFVDGFTWGPVATADIQLASETASAVPVQIIDSTFSTVPAGCQSFGGSELDSISTLGTNGLLGVGPFLQDCGGACTQTGSSNPGLYFNCVSVPCQVVAQPLAQQVSNPVGFFATDNNGVIVELPSANSAVASLSGSLVFGIGTQSNNGLNGATVFPLDSNGEITTTFNGTAYPAFVDSGSNAYFFLDSNTTSIPVCSDNSSFYCPSSTMNLSATTSSGSSSSTIKFAIQNADNLFSNQSAFVFPGLGGPNSGTFDWGLPFFFGRNVFTAIESASTPGGAGPYWAF
jgi:Protein of unknown function (DUF3443)